MKLPTIWTVGKAEAGRAERRRKEVRRSEKKEDAGVRKGREVAIHYVFRMICGSGGSKSNLAKAAGAEPAGQMRDEKLHAVVARSTFLNQNCEKHTILRPLLEVEMSKKCTSLRREVRFQVKMYKTHHVRTTFGRWDAEKLHAVVARSTFVRNKLNKKSCSDHFWKLRYRKKCTPLWREAHFQVKMYKTYHSQTTFGSWDVEKVHVVVARSTFPSQKCKKVTGSDHSWKMRCWKIARHCGAKWREAHVQVKMYKTPHVRTTFDGWDWQAQGIVHSVKSEQNLRVL